MSSPRYLVQVDATFLSRSQSVPFLTDHVSTEGLFVRTDSPPRVMELLRIELTLPPLGEKIVLNGMVTQLVLPRAKDSVPGAEIAFFAKEGAAAARWNDFIAFVAKNHPEAAHSVVRFGEHGVDQIRREAPRLDAAFSIRIDPTSKATLAVANISKGACSSGPTAAS